MRSINETKKKRQNRTDALHLGSTSAVFSNISWIQSFHKGSNLIKLPSGYQAR